MSVIDTSPAYDWTNVAVINPPSGTHGRDYPTYGFVYPERGPREIAENPSQNEHGSYVAEPRDVADVSSGSAPLHLAVATEDQLGDIRVAPATRENNRGKSAVTHSAHKSLTAHGRHHAAAYGKPSSPSHLFHSTIAHPPSRPVRTTEARHHRA
jgi:hypothetical protein